MATDKSNQDGLLLRTVSSPAVGELMKGQVLLQIIRNPPQGNIWNFLVVVYSVPWSGIWLNDRLNNLNFCMVFNMLPSWKLELLKGALNIIFNHESDSKYLATEATLSPNSLVNMTWTEHFITGLSGVYWVQMVSLLWLSKVSLTVMDESGCALFALDSMRLWQVKLCILMLSSQQSYASARLHDIQRCQSAVQFILYYLPLVIGGPSVIVVSNCTKDWGQVSHTTWHTFGHENTQSDRESDKLNQLIPEPISKWISNKNNTLVCCESLGK